MTLMTVAEPLTTGENTAVRKPGRQKTPATKRPTTKIAMQNGHAPQPTKTQVIDCDVHHNLPNQEALFPYLPRQYVEYIKDFGSMMPGVGYTNMPGSGARTDLWDGKDINPSTDPAIAIERHLDKYDLRSCFES